MLLIRKARTIQLNRYQLILQRAVRQVRCQTCKKILFRVLHIIKLLYYYTTSTDASKVESIEKVISQLFTTSHAFSAI